MEQSETQLAEQQQLCRETTARRLRWTPSRSCLIGPLFQCHVLCEFHRQKSVGSKLFGERFDEVLGEEFEEEGLNLDCVVVVVVIVVIFAVFAVIFVHLAEGFETDAEVDPVFVNFAFEEEVQNRFRIQGPLGGDVLRMGCEEEKMEKESVFTSEKFGCGGLVRRVDYLVLIVTSVVTA
jgi:hypothetical protein